MNLSSRISSPLSNGHFFVAVALHRFERLEFACVCCLDIMALAKGIQPITSPNMIFGSMGRIFDQKRRQSITEEVRRELVEMHARYGTAHTGEFMGGSALRDEELI